MTEPTRTRRTADRRDRMLLGCVILISAIIAGWMLRATAVVVIPIVFSLFLALLVAPVDRWARRHAPARARWLGHFAAMGVILLALLAFTGSIWIAAQQVLERIPEGAEGWETIVPLAGPTETEPPASSGGRQGTDAESGAGAGAGTLSEVVSLFAAAGDSFLGRLADWAAGYASTVLSTAGAVLGGAVLVFFLTLLMLIEAPKWRDKLSALGVPSSEGAAMSATGEIAERLRRYLWARTIMGVLTAILYVGWLWIFGLDLLFVWGLLAFVLNYIPTLGSLIAGLLPVAFAFLTRDFGTAAIIGAGILAIEQVIGNYVDPKVQGREVSLSPLVVLVVLLFWSWIWGVAGAVLAVPITIAVLIFSAHVPGMQPLAVLLGNGPRDGPDADASRE